MAQLFPSPLEIAFFYIFLANFIVFWNSQDLQFPFSRIFLFVFIFQGSSFNWKLRWFQKSISDFNMHDFVSPFLISEKFSKKVFHIFRSYPEFKITIFFVFGTDVCFCQGVGFFHVAWFPRFAELRFASRQYLSVSSLRVSKSRQTIDMATKSRKIGKLRETATFDPLQNIKTPFLPKNSNYPEVNVQYWSTLYARIIKMICKEVRELQQKLNVYVD